MSHARWISAFAGAGLSVLVVLPTAAQTIKKTPIQPMSGVAGSLSFRGYCAACHGIDGRGAGPAAAALKVAPPDLTQLSARHGGRFPMTDVTRTIGGDDIPIAHGSREMPMWGAMFRSVEDRGIAGLRLRNLVVYLESIQSKQ